MRRDGDMHDSPALVREEDEHEEHAIRGSWHDEKIGGHDLPDMLGQDGTPRLGRRFGGAGEVLCDGGLTDLHAELQQLTVDAWRAPHNGFSRATFRISARTFGATGRSTGASTTSLPRPEQAESLAMPGDNGIGLHDDECCSPPAPHT
jgi:hypothetical protein